MVGKGLADRGPDVLRDRCGPPAVQILEDAGELGAHRHHLGRDVRQPVVEDGRPAADAQDRRLQGDDVARVELAVELAVVAARRS
jgi:hypothetical protein